MKKTTLQEANDYLSEMSLLEHLYTNSMIDMERYKTLIEACMAKINEAVFIHTRKSQSDIYLEAIQRLATKANKSLMGISSFIADLIILNKYSYLELMLKEISDIMDAEYVRSASSCNVLYCVSKRDLLPHRISMGIPNIQSIAVFHTEEDALSALEICDVWGSTER